LIAAGGVFGLLGIVIALLQDPEISTHTPQWLTRLLHLPWPADLFAKGPVFFGKLGTIFHSHVISSLATSNLFGLFVFLLLAGSLFHFARKKL